MRLTDFEKDTLESRFGDCFAHFGRGLGSINGEQVGYHSSNMRGCHRGSADAFGFAIVPGGKDILAGSEDINNRSPIGKRGPLVNDVAGSDGDSRGATSRAVRAGIVCGPEWRCISGGDDDMNTGVGHLENKINNGMIIR